MSNTSGEKEISKKWPVPSNTGIEADSYHKGRQINLVPEEKSLVPSRKKENL